MSHASSPLDAMPSPDTLRAQMTAWRVAHPRATFAELEVEASRQVAALRAERIAVALAAGEPETAPVCATCGVPMHRAGRYERTITTSHQEQVPVRGHRYRCSACGTELFPPR